MKLTTVLSALLITGCIAGSTEQAGAVVYCNPLNILPAASRGPVSQLRRPVTFEISHDQLILSREAIF